MSTLLANQAFVNSLVSLCTELALLVGVVVAYIKLRTTAAAQGEQISAVQKQADQQQIAGGAASPVTINVPQQHAAGGPTAPAVGHGLVLPAWDQTADLAVGGISLTGPIDCGPECVAMCLRVLTGVIVPASYLRWLIKGPGDQSLMTADDLVQMFSINEHQAHRRDAPYEALQHEVGDSVRAGKPGIILGRWLSPVGHWMCFENVDAARGILFRDPWGGPQYWVGWDRVRAQYEGSYVHVDERAAYAA